MHSPFQASSSQPGSGRETGNTAPGKRESRQGNLKVIRPTPSFRFHFLQASSQKHSLLHWHLFPPAPTPSHPLPASLYSAGFLRPNLSAWQGAFPFSSIFPVSNMGGSSLSPESSLCPLIIWLKHILLFQANVIWSFQAFKDKKCQRTLLSLFTTSHKARHGLPHRYDIQETCSKCQKEDLGGFYF